MEKIYLEKNNGKNKKKKNNYNTSVLLSYVLAFVAMFGIVSTMFQTSYAIPVIAGLPDTFVGAQNPTDTAWAEAAAGGYKINTYKTADGEIVYCLERDVDFGVGESYTKDTAITDYGLLYLMANVYPNYEFKDATGVAYPEAVQVYLSQAAIWQYLYDINALGNQDDITSGLATLGSITRLNYGVNDPLNPQYVDLTADAASLIAPFVSAAKSNNVAPVTSLNVNISGSDVSLTTDGKYYQSELISVTASPSDNFEDYSISLTAPEGSIIINENGDELTTLTGLDVTTKFYVRIPVDKVTEENKTVKVTIDGNYLVYKGNYYVSGAYQKISSVYTEPEVLQKGLDIPINLKVEVPDTGLSGSATLYFLGIAILIIGLGVIYVNVRPSKAN